MNIVPLKLFILVGLLSWIVALTQLGSDLMEGLLWAGVVAILLGVIQPYVSLPHKVKLTSRAMSSLAEPLLSPSEIP